MRVFTVPAVITLTLLIGFLAPGTSHATLGQGSSSVSSDAGALSGSLGSTDDTNPNFTTRDLTSPGCTIREFLTKKGVVFAIAWKGNHHPDLKPLLGGYYDEYQKNFEQQRSERVAKKHLAIRAPMRVKSSSTIVEMGGHMRSLHGLAYLPMRMPDGVSPNDLRY